MADYEEIRTVQMCPICGGQSKVYGTQENGNGTEITRYRRCADCNIRYITKEKFEKFLDFPYTE